HVDSTSSQRNCKSCPGVDPIKTKKRNESAPYLSMTSIGSTPLPSDLLILRPSASRINPSISTSLNGASSVHSRDCKIILATQKKMMSYPVTSTSVGKYRLKSSLSSSGQPIVENGHRADENHVSNTSLSCSQFSLSAGAS